MSNVLQQAAIASTPFLNALVAIAPLGIVWGIPQDYNSLHSALVALF
ncbi:MAG: hypothetical protein RMY30_024955 [Nostoc sp. CmiSLP01]|nr:hypothetical protein [Nostoc sp. CmiSLP01]MDZ8286339.1 hypothetical protein [Nostoc sp. ChiSLP01]